MKIRGFMLIHAMHTIPLISNLNSLNLTQELSTVSLEELKFHDRLAPTKHMHADMKVGVDPHKFIRQSSHET